MNRGWWYNTLHWKGWTWVSVQPFQLGNNLSLCFLWTNIGMFIQSDGFVGNFVLKFEKFREVRFFFFLLQRPFGRIFVAEDMIVGVHESFGLNVRI
jgi:hypothetical protein